MRPPRLRGAHGLPAPYPINKFPVTFVDCLARQIVYRLHVMNPPKIEGSVWEQIFAKCVGGEWVRSVLRLDDVKLPNCSWSGKVVSGNPLTASTVRLISGRNNISYSYGKSPSKSNAPDDLGQKVLGIWNTRLSEVSARNEHLRTVVLIYSLDYSTYGVFEKPTELYFPDQYTWKWNVNDNLEGFDKLTNRHRFTWQLNGQQFTVIDEVPRDRICFRLKLPPQIDIDSALMSIGFDSTWVIKLPVAQQLDPVDVETGSNQDDSSQAGAIE